MLVHNFFLLYFLSCLFTFLYLLPIPTLLRLLRILLAHELLQNECKPFEWRDEFAHEALHILAQHAVQVKREREANMKTTHFLLLSFHFLSTTM